MNSYCIYSIEYYHALGLRQALSLDILLYWWTILCWWVRRESSCLYPFPQDQTVLWINTWFLFPTVQGDRVSLASGRANSTSFVSSVFVLNHTLPHKTWWQCDLALGPLATGLWGVLRDMHCHRGGDDNVLSIMHLWSGQRTWPCQKSSVRCTDASRSTVHTEYITLWLLKLLCSLYWGIT